MKQCQNNLVSQPAGGIAEPYRHRQVTAGLIIPKHIWMKMVEGDSYQQAAVRELALENAVIKGRKKLQHPSHEVTLFIDIFIVIKLTQAVFHYKICAGESQSFPQARQFEYSG